MPSFLSKLFRKKKGGPDGETSTSASKGSSKKSRKSTKKKGTKVDKADVKPTSPGKDTVKSSPAQELRRPSNGTSNYSSNSGSEPHVRVLSPRSGNQAVMDHNHNSRDQNELALHTVNSGSHSQGKQHHHHHHQLTSINSNTSGGGHGNSSWGAGPVDLDESDLGSDTDENNNNNMRNNPKATQQQRLSVQQLDRFNRDMQQQRTGTTQFYMPKEELPKFSAGNVPVMDDMNRSDASSSSFNLSTDAEDTEYEALKRRGVVPNPTVLDSSHLSGISSPTNYNTDGDNSIFPALQTDDEGTLTERSRESNHQPEGILPAKVPSRDEDNVGTSSRANLHSNALSSSSSSNNNKMIQPKMNPNRSTSDDDEERAWTVSPTKDGSHPFPFHNPTSPTPRRNFTSPKLARSPNSFTTSVLSTSQADTSNEFANFADFSNVTFPADTESWGAPSGSSNKTGNNKVLVDGTPPPVSPGRKPTHRSSASAADMTLSDILAQAKGKRSSTSSHRSTGSGSRRVSSSSVNSAPAMTAKYLRYTHNLRPVGAARHGATDNDGTTPVSDIIDSLEIANASRAAPHHHQHGNSNSSKAMTTTTTTTTRSSQGGSGADQSRAAKDRMKERRRRESSATRRRSDPNHNTTESSEGSDQEASESWLFDEVTGALGPRGIAADLESLSGRSKSSSGNKSHKSHRSHRSHRSHGRSSRRRKSSSKHHPSSGESVDSRGSRHSRGSRYSHRSTRSYLSQMSEQSRSVANDLLRLEMQLAMVGSQDNAAAAAAAATAGSSASVASRASRKSSRSSARRTVAIARRNKVTIQAPPGKLGIILANKADSKGTVVSGVRSSSVLSERISPGDRIVAIDGEDVSLMTVSEITTIMARKSDFERTLTVLTTPKHLSMPSGSTPSSSTTQPSAAPAMDTSSARNGMASPKSNKEYESHHNRYHGR